MSHEWKRTDSSSASMTSVCRMTQSSKVTRLSFDPAKDARFSWALLIVTSSSVAWVSAMPVIRQPESEATRIPGAARLDVGEVTTLDDDLRQGERLEVRTGQLDVGQATRLERHTRRALTGERRALHTNTVKRVLVLERVHAERGKVLVEGRGARRLSGTERHRAAV